VPVRTVCVNVDGRTTELAPGDELAFGRDPGPGQIAVGDRRVSGRHGVIAASEGGWAVRSTASYFGFTVYDCDSPSRLCVPLGAGPVPVPFAWAVIAVEIRGDRHLLDVRAEDTCGWAEGWAGAAGDTAGEAGASSTIPAWAGVRWTDRSGRALRWYQVLVAMCEPRFAVPPQERIPSNGELARRLGVSQGVVENHYLVRLRKELGLQKFDDQSRLAAVVIAISQGLVTRADLAVLDLPGDDVPE
jgi:hypothetical protein